MIDRKKVIQALEEFVGIGSLKWCPHKIDESFKDMQKLLTDALDILKEQENEKKRNSVIVCPHCGKRVK